MPRALIKKLIPIVIPKLGVVAPTATARLAFELFVRPKRYTRPEKESVFWGKCSPLKTKSGVSARTYGQGPTIWFVHGWAGRSSQFYVIAESLAASGYQIVLWDGPAHGENPESKTNLIQFSKTLADDLNWFTQSQGKKIKALIGHSFGGAASVFVSSRYYQPEKLISIAAPALISRVFTEYWRLIQLPEKAQKRFIQIAEKAAGFNAYELDSTSLKAVPQVQFLVIHDEEDRDVSYQSALRFKEIRPDAELLSTIKLGHQRILRSELVLEKIIEFIKK